MTQIRGLLADNPSWNRSRLSRELCAQWDWRNDKGQMKCQDPATVEIYSFVTSNLTLPPGIIAFLYKMRWDVEKVFDEKKSKLKEKQAWAKSPVAKSQHANFLCLAHNLLVLLEQCIEQQECINDHKAQTKRNNRIKTMEERIRERGLKPNPMIMNCRRITQRSFQFIRWLRYCLDFQTSWSEAMNMLHPLMQRYIL